MEKRWNLFWSLSTRDDLWALFARGTPLWRVAEAPVVQILLSSLINCVNQGDQNSSAHTAAIQHTWQIDNKREHTALPLPFDETKYQGFKAQKILKAKKTYHHCTWIYLSRYDWSWTFLWHFCAVSDLYFDVSCFLALLLTFNIVR